MLHTYRSVLISTDFFEAIVGTGVSTEGTVAGIHVEIGWGLCAVQAWVRYGVKPMHTQRNARVIWVVMLVVRVMCAVGQVEELAIAQIPDIDWCVLRSCAVWGVVWWCVVAARPRMNHISHRRRGLIERWH